MSNKPLFNRYNMNASYKINLECYDYSGRGYYLYDKRVFDFSAVELQHHIVTCGMPRTYFTKQVKNERKNEILYKMYLMQTALEVDQNDFVVVSDNIKYLDTTEKAFISYNIGMFITKLLSNREFGYTYLVHLGVVKKYKNVKLLSRRQPDLIGFNIQSNNYSIFEAKGRCSKNISPKTLFNARKQINSVDCIDKLKLKEGVICVAHPIQEGCRIICSVYRDFTLGQEEKVDNTKKIKISTEELLYLYYAPIYELVKEEKENGDLFIDEISCRVKMPKEIYKLFKKYLDSDLEVSYEELASELSKIVQHISKENNNSDLITVDNK